jgi:hypothetical protein
MTADVSIDRVMQALPTRVAAIVERLFREHRSSPIELHRAVSDYRNGLEGAARDGRYIDVILATEVANLLHRLIDTLQVPVEPEHHRLVQAAVRYFVTEEDAESDRDSLIGFEDDRLVAAAVAEELGLDPGGLGDGATGG